MLCKEVISAYNRPYCALQPPEPLRVLDIGTGSGCIAVTLALDLWNCTVTAWDISGDALIIARENAHRLQARVNFELHDVLQLDKAAFEADPFERHGKNCPIILPHDPRRPTTMEAMPPAISPADDGHPHTEDLEQFSTK